MALANEQDARNLVPRPCFALAEGATRPVQTSGLGRERPSGRECPNGDGAAVIGGGSDLAGGVFTSSINLGGAEH